MTDIVDIYLETGDFHEAVKQSGLPTHIAHLKLIKSGCLKFSTVLERESGSELHQPNILLVPMQFIEAQKELHVSQSGPWFQDFKVEPEELQPLLKDYVQLRKDGLF